MQGCVKGEKDIMRSLVYSVSAFLTGIMAMLTVGITNNIATGLGVSCKSLGILISVYTLTFAISGPILNTILSKVNDKSVIIGSFVVFTLGNILAFCSKDLSMLVISRLVTAVGWIKGRNPGNIPAAARWQR